MSDIQLKLRPGAGFFSDVIQSLIMVSRYFRENRDITSLTYPVIDSTNAFSIYKSNETTDIWRRVFAVKSTSPPSIIDEMPSFAPASNIYRADFTNHTEMITTNLMKGVMFKYFSVSSEVTQKINQFISTYNIDCPNTCYVYYRGTDKLNKEAVDVPIESYFDVIDNICPGCDILVQTDCNLFLSKFKHKYSNVKIIEETWTGINEYTVRKSIHKELARSDDALDNIMNLTASIHIGSQCKHIIGNTSNVTLYLQLIRAAVGLLSARTDNIFYIPKPNSPGDRHLPQFKK